LQTADFDLCQRLGIRQLRKASFAVSRSPRSILAALDPRRSLAAGIIWLVVGLAASFAIAASLWAGQVAREIVVQQHVRRLALETDQLGADLGEALNARLQAIRAVSELVPPAAIFARLTEVYPELGWIAQTDATGRVSASDGSIAPGSGHGEAAWFLGGRRAPWIGVIERETTQGAPPRLGDFAAPLTDAAGQVTGVVTARMLWRRASGVVPRLSEMLDVQGSAQTLILDGDGSIVSGATAALGNRWDGVPADPSVPDAPHFETRDEQIYLVARAEVQLPGMRQHWQVQLSEPKELVYQRANALAIRIWWISICVGAITAVIGALGAQRLTNRLQALTRSAAAVGRNEHSRIEVPPGQDEAAQLGAAFAKVLDDLRQERSDLLQLSEELERRVASRTREVERLAEESRYAAVVRERLQIARDLHDTLAHSMMAMLSEIRVLRKLQLQHPESLQNELARVEQVAQAGLNEARSAIAQMRVNSVRDTGLGPALAHAVERFKNRTTLEIDFSADPAAARFGDQRAEVAFRIAEEALRNIERHASASRASVALRNPESGQLQLEIADDGVGFDTTRAHPGHFGLLGLREQAQLIGALLDIDSAPGRGTRLRLTLRTAPES
jgi:signal transduction histidine kinase